MLDPTAEKLRSETLKWLERLESETKGMRKSEKADSSVDSSIENIKAYISDCKHFLGKGDFINAFEAVIYAWGIWETCLRTGLLLKGKG